MHLSGAPSPASDSTCQSTYRPTATTSKSNALRKAVRIPSYEKISENTPRTAPIASWNVKLVAGTSDSRRSRYAGLKFFFSLGTTLSMLHPRSTDTHSRSFNRVTRTNVLQRKSPAFTVQRLCHGRPFLFISDPATLSRYLALTPLMVAPGSARGIF